MRLLDYLNETSIDDEAFATLVGGVSKHAVKKWKYGERRPEADRIIRIEDLTMGRVSLRDWQTVPSRESDGPATRQAGEAAA